MYAVINHLHFDRPADEFREPLEREGVPLLAGQSSAASRSRGCAPPSTAR